MSLALRVDLPEAWTVITVPPGGGEHHRADHLFKLSATQEEMLAKVRARRKSDPKFATQFRGWRFFAIQVDEANCVEI